MNVFDLA
jgi:hypothetical protein